MARSAPEADPRRRAFLVGGAAAVVALALGPARARAAAAARRLRLVHTHTGERIDVAYVEDGQRIPGALAQLDRFLRDFRTGEVHPIDPDVLDVAWAIAAAAEQPRGTFEIVSAYRSPRTNAMLREHGRGVAAHSMHLQGKALDLRLRGVPTEHLRALALALERGGVGFYRGPDFVHVDTGRVRWWGDPA